MSAPPAVPPLPPPPEVPIPGSVAAEIAIVASCLTIFMLYHVYYFERHRILHTCLFRRNEQDGYSGHIELWTTAIESRVIWAREMIKQPKKDDALLAMHTMRYSIIVHALSSLFLQALCDFISLKITLKLLFYFDYAGM